MAAQLPEDKEPASRVIASLRADVEQAEAALAKAREEIAAFKVLPACANDLVETHERTVEERDQARADLERALANGARMREKLEYAGEAMVGEGDLWRWRGLYEWHNFLQDALLLDPGWLKRRLAEERAKELEQVIDRWETEGMDNFKLWLRERAAEARREGGQ